ncbi:hypothetical protein Zmor_015391 [Zophobas morio]|uniref:DUF7041 domain-containing protein n=1 Tax=Zophobas morio TaxID=2755281 RepID=A0AA38IHV2_9CUCU|nr:hypothetical protein Zmor_015391 [Zophobas morio]
MCGLELQRPRKGLDETKAALEESKNQHHEVDAVKSTTMKVPPFWQKTPALWFSQIEAQFHTYGVKSDISKYYMVVSTLDGTILRTVSDIPANPPAEHKYETIKNKIIAEFTDSQERQIRKLIDELELGDKTPSQRAPFPKTTISPPVAKQLSKPSSEPQPNLSSSSPFRVQTLSLFQRARRR